MDDEFDDYCDLGNPNGHPDRVKGNIPPPDHADRGVSPEQEKVIQGLDPGKLVFERRPFRMFQENPHRFTIYKDVDQKTGASYCWVSDYDIGVAIITSVCASHSSIQSSQNTEWVHEGDLLIPNDTGGQAAIPIITEQPVQSSQSEHEKLGFNSTDLILLAHDEWKRREERKHNHENIPWVAGFINGFLTDKKWARDYVDKLRQQAQEGDFQNQTYEDRMERIWTVAKKISLEIVKESGA